MPESLISMKMFYPVTSSVYHVKYVLVFSFVEFAEADSFFCFTNMMSEIRDNFIKTLDDSQCGIGKVLSIFHNYEVVIEKWIQWVSVWHHSAGLIMPNIDPKVFLFTPHNNDKYFLHIF